jgi:hypothetical protein
MGIQPAGGGQAAGVGGRVAVIVGVSDGMDMSVMMGSRVAVTRIAEGSIGAGDVPAMVPSSMVRDKLPRTMLVDRSAIPSPIPMERRSRILILYF